MNLFGIGPLELLLILLLALIIFGPNEIQKTGKTIGKTLNKLVRSEGWRTINQTSKELKNLPNRLMRESGLDELKESTQQELAKTSADLKHSISTTPTSLPNPVLHPQKTDNGDQSARPDSGGDPNA
jgi:Sec-independent protein translocase protein TatA